MLGLTQSRRALSNVAPAGGLTAVRNWNIGTLEQWRTTTLPHDFDAGMMSGSSRKSGVPRNEWGIERFGQSKISRVVRCQIASKCPDPTEENIMRVAI